MGNKQGKKTGGDGGDDEDNQISNTLEDRVFVCVGKYKNKDKESQKPAVWVMTLDSEFEIVTFWDCIHHQQVELHGRIKTEKEEGSNLQAYLRSEALDKNEEKAKKALQDWREKVEEMSSSDDEESDDQDKKNESLISSLEDESNADGKESHKASSEEEHKEDSDFID